MLPVQFGRFPRWLPASCPRRVMAFPASTRRQRRRGDDRAPSAASRSSTGRADECRRAVAVVAVIVHGPAGPHGGAGAPAERALPYMCTRPPRVAPPTSPCRRHRTFRLPVAPPRANVDGRRLPAATTRRRNRVHDPARNRLDRHPRRSPRGTATAHVWSSGADPGRSHRRLPPGLPGPAVPIPQHRSRPDRPISPPSSAATREPPR